MADKTVRGRFVWHELMTSDSVAAYGFYAKALNWKTVTPQGDASHTSFEGPSGPLGSAAQLDDGAPNWIPYIGSTDLEKTLSDATDGGGTVAKSITAVAGGGHYAILTDPQGATFGVYASDASASREGPAKRGEYSWHELATTDAGAAMEFYSNLFGWDQIAEHDMGPAGMYTIFGRNGRQLGGIYKKMEGQPGPAWLGYVRVKDLDKTIKKVKYAGGTLINGPMDVPGGDRIAQFLDPQGAAFAVHVVAADLQPPAAKPDGASAPEAEEESASAAEPVAAAPARKAAPKKPAARKTTPAAKKKAAPAVRKKAGKVAAKAKSPARKTAKAGKKKAAKKSVKKAAKKVAKQARKKAAPKKAAKKAKSARKAK
jgi:predicted enzyme related to lactoylglutathione lyase